MTTLSDRVFAAAPILPAPLPPETLPALAPGAKRFVAAADGLHLQVRSPALYVSVQLAALPLPFGPPPPIVIDPNPLASPALLDALRSFALAAQEEPSREIAGAILATAEGPKLRLLAPLSSSAAHVTYDDSGLDDDFLLVDLHSHGRLPAYFSTTDDASDLSRRGPYLALVVGMADDPEELHLATRLVVPPYLIPLGRAWNQALLRKLRP